MPTIFAEAAGSRKNINTATTTVIPGNGTLVGIWVSSATTATIAVSDANGNIANTFTPSGASYYKLPFSFSGGLSIVTTGTIDCTVGFNV